MSVDPIRDALVTLIRQGHSSHYAAPGPEEIATAILARFLVIPRTDRAAVDRMARAAFEAIYQAGWTSIGPSEQEDWRVAIRAALDWPEDDA